MASARNEDKVYRRPSRRRRWRRVYHRSRLYVFLAVLILLVLVVFLPISSSWLTGRLESYLRKKTGLPITLDDSRVRLSSGELTLTGLELPGRDGGEPFRVESVRLDGVLADLLEGKGGWPNNVTVTLSSPLEVAASDAEGEGWEVEGSLRSLVAHLGDVKSPGRTGNGFRLRDLTDVTIPETMLQNVRLLIRQPAAEGPDLAINVQSAWVGPRSVPGEPVVLRVKGTGAAGNAERFHGELEILPGAERILTDLWLGGFELPVPIPGIGRFRVRCRDVELDGQVTLEGNEGARGTLDLMIHEFEMAESRIGGERWVDHDMTLRVRGAYDGTRHLLEEGEAHLLGEGVDILTEGRLEMRRDWDGEARLRVRRVPPAAIALGRRTLLFRGVELDAVTSQTLSLDISARGPFAEPEELEYDGTLVARGGRVYHPALLRPVDLVEGRVEATNEVVVIPRLEFDYSGIHATLEGRMPILDEGESGTAHVRASLSGKPEDALTVAKAKGFVPRELNSATMPLDLSIDTDVALTRADGVLHYRAFRDGIPYTGMLTWGTGEVTLRSMPGAVSLKPGALRFSSEGGDLSHFSAQLADIVVSADGTFDSPVFMDPLPNFELSASLEGPVRSMTKLAQDWVDLPLVATTASGDLRVEFEADGSLEEMAATQYKADVILKDVAGTLRLPDSELSIDKLVGRIQLSNDDLVITGLRAGVEDSGELIAEGELTDQGLELNVEVSASADIANKISPRDVEELVLGGQARARAEVLLSPREAMPDEYGVVRRWLKLVRENEGPLIGVVGEPAIGLKIQGRILPGAGAMAYHRQFPHPVTDIRGDITFDERGIYFNRTLSSWGDAENVEISGQVLFAHEGPPLRIEFSAKAPRFLVNDWTSGWGKQPWSERPFVTPRPSRGGLRRVLEILHVQGHVEAGYTEFLTTKAQDVSTDLVYESWRGDDNHLYVDNLSATVYGGSVTGEADLFFRKAGRTAFQTNLLAERVDANGFLADLKGEPQTFVGKASGSGNLSGEIGDYRTWTGTGDFDIVESRFIGDQVFSRITSYLKLGRKVEEAETEIAGSALIQDRKVYLPEVRVTNPEMELIADGSVDFSGNLDVLIAVRIIGQQFKKIPIVGAIGGVVDRLTDTFMTAEVVGHIDDPHVRTVPFKRTWSGLFGIGKMAVGTASDAALAGTGALGRALPTGGGGKGESGDDEGD